MKPTTKNSVRVLVLKVTTTNIFQKESLRENVKNVKARVYLDTLIAQVVGQLGLKILGLVKLSMRDTTGLLPMLWLDHGLDR
jgi:hypothetical protein